MNLRSSDTAIMHIPNDTASSVDPVLVVLASAIYSELMLLSANVMANGITQSIAASAFLPAFEACISLFTALSSDSIWQALLSMASVLLPI